MNNTKHTSSSVRLETNALVRVPKVRARTYIHGKRLCAVYYLLGKSMTQKAHLSPSGETVVKRTVNSPTDGSAGSSFASKNGDGHEWCKLGVGSRFGEAERLCVHLDDLNQYLL